MHLNHSSSYKTLNYPCSNHYIFVDMTNNCKNQMESKMKLKLLIDNNENKVLFAEAGKEFIDFLFSIMSFPLGTVMELLTNKEMVGCLGDLYQSIESLSDGYLQPNHQNQKKESILKPKAPVLDIESPLLLTNSTTTTTSTTTVISDPKPVERKAYVCCKLKLQPRGCHCSNSCYCFGDSFGNYYRTKYNHHLKYVADDPTTVCPECESEMSVELSYVVTESDDDAKEETEEDCNALSGFVRDVVSYMVMDNLEVKAMSTSSTITGCIDMFKIKDLSSLEEREVDVGVPEGLKILKQSLQSKNVLTNVFLRKRKASVILQP